jgi:uncharacterized protein
VQRNVFIFHGTRGYPEENWFPWLKEKLEQKGYNVFVPQFPTPDGESFNSWMNVLNTYKKYITRDTILIGHSRGGRFLLLFLETLTNPVYASFLVSTSIGIKQVAFSEEANKFANGWNFAWEKIKTKSQHFFVYHSDNDPYVHLDNGKELSRILGVKLALISNAGHFNTKSGYVKFERLLTDIENLL